jgi:ATP-dependent DNA helicase RecG
MPADKPLSAPQKALRKLGLVRDIDLALHLPLRYEDETRLVRLSEIQDGQSGQFEAEVITSDWTYRPRRQLVVVVRDGEDTCTVRFFNAYPSMQKSLAVGQRVRLRGEVRGGFMGRTMMHPVVQPAGGELSQALTPVYPTSAGLPQAYLRRAVLAGLSRCLRSGALVETVPAEALPPVTWPLSRALQFLHHPTPDVALATLEDRSHPAWQRLKAEELLTQQLSQWQSRQERLQLRAPALLPRGAAADLPAQLLRALPFGLTAAQVRVQTEIAADLARHEPMHRLLQGDVGSGKTVVAALAAAHCIASGWQCALMAPTEILAEQHFRKLIGWLEPLLQPLGLEVAWLTGSQKKKTRDAMLALIADGRAALVVGTHAVIQEQVQFRALALAIIDEQHRFGVAQRLALRHKLQPSADLHQPAAAEPHLLMMSATPIPRTLAMSYYADLDVSTLDELPPGRTPVVTKVVSEARREEVIERIRAQVAQGRQVYWVCPLIEESEALDLRNATDTHARLSEALQTPTSGNTVGVTPEAQADGGRVADAESRGGTGELGPRRIDVGLLHSRLPEADKKAIMARFVSGEMAVLVSTTVIEVGVDVPNASLMVVEHAERFGLSQLHQLRGRVGRGAAASACVLLYSLGEHGRLSETARERLRAMVETQDGFEIARRDLEIRGPGELLGARQSGVPMLRFADLEQDKSLLEWARQLAPRMGLEHPDLVRQHLHRWLGGKSDYLKA